MGWLSDWLSQVEIKSCAAAAASMAANPPPGVRPPSQESLANYLRHLDNGDPRWWLAKGKVWIPVLARVVSEPEEALEEKIRDLAAQDPYAAPHDPIVRDWFLKPLDLRNERLFPGIPPELSTRSAKIPPRVWWHAEAGAGRTLLGRWLSAGRGWEHREARTWSEALPDLPQHGRVYLELQEPERALTATTDLPEELRLCVVAPFPPNEPPKSVDRRYVLRVAGGERNPGAGQAPADSAGWHPVYTPPVAEWFEPMLDWVEARLRRSSLYDPPKVRACLSTLPVQDWVSTPGDLLDLLAVFDAEGVDEVFEEHTPRGEALVQAAVRRAVKRAPPFSAPAVLPRLEKVGAGILAGLETTRLRCGAAPALTAEAWQAMLPEEGVVPLDTAALEEVLRPKTAEAATQGLRMLARGPEARLRSLIKTRVLVPSATASGTLQLRPPWLQRVLTQIAAERLVAEGPEGLGALLLFAQSNEPAMERLLEQARRGELTLLSRCCEGVHRESPERLAALNAAFRVLGLCSALGDPLPVPLLERVWEVQLRYTWSQEGRTVPWPLLQLRGEQHNGLADYTGVWVLAALGLSLRLHEAGVALPPGPLNPWGRAVEAETAHTLDRYLPLAGSGAPEVQRALQRVSLVLLERLGQASLPARRWWETCGHHLLVRRARGVATPNPPGDELEQLLQLPRGLPALERACQDEGVPLDEVLRWCWVRWCEQNTQNIPPILWGGRHAEAEDQEHVGRLWRLAPAGELNDRILGALRSTPGAWPHLSKEVWERALDELRSTPGAWPYLSKELWARVLERWVDSTDLYLLPELVAAIPLDLGIQAARRLREQGQGHRARALHKRQWTEHTAATLDDLEQRAQLPLSVDREGYTEPGLLLLHAPEAVYTPILTRAQRWCAQPAAVPGLGAGLPVWLNNLVLARGPSWREAFQLLGVYVQNQGGGHTPTTAQRGAPG